MDIDELQSVIVRQSLIATGLLGASLWWYKRNLGEESGNAGRVLWIVWVVFGVLSLVILAMSGLGALVLGGLVTWAFCVAGSVLGSRLLVRSFRNREQDIWAMTLVFGLGFGLLGFLIVLFLVSPERNS